MVFRSKTCHMEHWHFSIAPLGCQLRWSTIYKEGNVIIHSMGCLDYLVWNGVSLLADHRNLAYIFIPEAVFRRFPRPLLDGWRTGEQSCLSSRISSCTSLGSKAYRGVASADGSRFLQSGCERWLCMPRVILITLSHRGRLCGAHSRGIGPKMESERLRFSRSTPPWARL